MIESQQTHCTQVFPLRRRIAEEHPLLQERISTLIGAQGAYQMHDMNNKRSCCSVRQRPMQTLELEERVHTPRRRTVLTLTQYGHLLVDDTSNHGLKFRNNPRQKN